MSFFGIPYAATEQIRRLHEASDSNIAAQEGLQQAGEDAAEISRTTRRQAVLERRRTQIAARALRERPLQTSAVREAVQIMISDMDHSADQRAQRRH